MPDGHGSVRDMLFGGETRIRRPTAQSRCGQTSDKGRLVDDGGADPRLILLNGAGSSIIRAPSVILVGVVVRAVRLHGDGREYASL